MLSMDESEIRNNWKLGRASNIYSDETDLVGSVELIIGDASLDSRAKRLRVPTVLKRPIHKLILLVAKEQCQL